MKVMVIFSNFENTQLSSECFVMFVFKVIVLVWNFGVLCCQVGWGWGRGRLILVSELGN